MKTLRFICVMVAMLLTTGFVCRAQFANVTVVVDGIKDAKGKIMIAVGEQSNPQGMKYDMVEVTSKEKVVCVLKDVPIGSCGLYVYQDLNDNYQLDKDENQIPVEPCYVKEKITVKEGGVEFTVKLMNVKEMMGNKD